MTGVAGPLFRNNRAASARFLAALTTGQLVSAGVVGILVYTIGSFVSLWVDESIRTMVLIAVVLLLGLADLVNRTPHVLRQVPQRFVRSLGPGTLGLVWGLDLGLFVTTQKTVSLIWICLFGVGLLRPEEAVLVMLVLAGISSLIIAAWSVGPWRAVTTKWSLAVQNRARRVSGVVAILGALGLAAQVLSV